MFPGFDLRNEICRNHAGLFGYPVDAALPGKVMAGLGSLASAVAVVAFRLSDASL